MSVWDKVLDRHPLHYDRAGAPISVERWAELFEDRGYQIIDKTSLTLGDERVEVSTVWLGIDHAFGDGPPLIFETMVFGGPHDDECVRYCTETQARQGHEWVVAVLFAERDRALRIAAAGEDGDDG